SSVLLSLSPSCLGRRTRRSTLFPYTTLFRSPGSKYSSIGGNVATNAGGMRAVKYGTTRDYVRAIDVVLPTGEEVSLGSLNIKDRDRKSTRLNSSHVKSSYAVFCLKKKNHRRQ